MPNDIDDLERMGIHIKRKRKQYPEMVTSLPTEAQEKEYEKEYELSQYPSSNYDQYSRPKKVSKPGTTTSYYVVVEDKRGRISTSTVRPEKIQQEQITLEHERREGKIKSYYITQNAREVNQLQQRYQQQQRKEAEELRRKIKYPGAETIKKQLATGYKHFEKQLSAPRKPVRLTRQAPPPGRAAPRTFWYSNPSPQYQQESSFSRETIPYRPVGRIQSFAPNRPFSPPTVSTNMKVPLFKPKFVRL